jgi:hypothetical protein
MLLSALAILSLYISTTCARSFSGNNVLVLLDDLAKKESYSIYFDSLTGTSLCRHTSNPELIDGF